MPADTWASPPTITPHGYGYSIAVAVTETATDDGPRYDGIRIEVRSLTATDIRAGIAADPDADDSHENEAFILALNETAPSIQPQLDTIIDLILKG